MRFWTIQSKEVIEMIQRDGFYQPDFSKSRYLKETRALHELYDIILQSFNEINGVRLPGLIFAFAWSDGRVIDFIETIEEFEDFIKTKEATILSFWNKLDKNDFVIMELEYQERFNPIFIDMNDFQLLMPPITVLYPYTNDSVRRILTSIVEGKATISEIPSGVMQAHLPYIEARNVVDIYPLFDLE